MSGLLTFIPIVVFLTGMTLVLAIYWRSKQEREIMEMRLGPYSTVLGAASLFSPSSGVLRQHRLSSIRGMDRLLAHRGLGEKMALDLARAAVPLRVGEYLLIRWLLSLVLFLAGTLAAQTIIAGVLLGVGGFYLPKLYVIRCEKKRIKTFDDQLVDSLSLMANSLRSGFGLLQGLEAVSREMPPPVSEEFNQVLHEIRMGANTEDALINLTRRVRSADLDLMVTAMLIQRTVGGNLSEVLDNIGHTIRERVRILREIRTLTAQERLSGYIIGGLPVFMLVAISIVNRSYVEMLFFTPVGQIMLGVAAILEVVGFYITKRIVSIEV